MLAVNLALFFGPLTVICSSMHHIIYLFIVRLYPPQLECELHELRECLSCLLAWNSTWHKLHIFCVGNG